MVYDGGGSALERLREATRAADRLSGLGDDLRELSERVTALYYECEDIGLTAEKMLEKNDADPVRQEEVAARLDLLRRLERRYGTTPEMMLERLEEIRRELQEIEGVDERLEEAALQEEKLRENMLKRASALQASRKLWMQRFAQAVEAECRDLNMAGTRLEGEFAEKEMDESGDRTLRFLIAPNRGEAFRPLSQTASGGELSRLMLAVETAMAEKAPVPTMIFDEVDSGISGSAAQAVADKMRRLAKSHQVLCVTHLQQLAAAAEHHYFVRKSFNGERTQTDISELDRAGRVREIARLLGGDEKTALAHAEKMLRA